MRGKHIPKVPRIPTTLTIVNSSSNLYIPQPVSLEKKTTWGWPRKVVDVELLKEAMNPTHRISQVLLAEKLGIHRNTLWVKLKENSINSSFTEMSDENLDQIIKGYLDSHPNSGIRYLTGHLHTQGFCIQRSCLEQSTKRLDCLGQILRQRTTAKKPWRQYHVSRPNTLWHIDGHHKLILWGIIIHGVIDGYSRKVVSKARNLNSFTSLNHRLLVFVQVQITWPQLC